MGLCDYTVCGSFRMFQNLFVRSTKEYNQLSVHFLQNSPVVYLYSLPATVKVMEDIL